MNPPLGKKPCGFQTSSWPNAFAYVLFQMPYNLAAGGVSGLGIIVNNLTGFSPGLFYFTANIPLFILGFLTLGKWRFLFTSTLAVVVFSGATEFLIVHMPTVFTQFPITENKLLATIYCGLLIGIGSGIIYRFGGTIGGTSIITRIIYNKTGFPMSQSGLYVDVIIIVVAGVVFSWETSLLAFLALLIAGMSADFAMEGASQMRTLMIITKNPEPLRYAIINELKRAVTMWQVKGGYSGEERTLLYLTVLRSRVYDVKFIINRIDPDAFMVVGVSQQIWGGYTLNKKKVKPIASYHDADRCPPRSWVKKNRRCICPKWELLIFSILLLVKSGFGKNIWRTQGTLAESRERKRGKFTIAPVLDVTVCGRDYFPGLTHGHSLLP